MGHFWEFVGTVYGQVNMAVEAETTWLIFSWQILEGKSYYDSSFTEMCV